MKNMKAFAGAIFTLLMLAGIASADDYEQDKNMYWPQWRGPLGNGVAPLSDAPLHFSATENVKWKFEDPGRGFSTPIIWGDKIFMTTALEIKDDTPPQPPPAGGGRRGRMRGGRILAQSFALLCIDRNTGDLLWRRVANETLPHEGIHRQLGSYANQSAVTDGEHVYAFFGSFGLYAYDLDGNKLWDRDFGVKMQIYNRFGESSSPALHGDTIVVQFDHEGNSFIEALDKHTGETIWRHERDEDTSWSSPFILEHEGKAQAVFSASAFVTSYDLETGDLLWKCSGMSPHPIPMAVSGHGMVFMTSGSRRRALKAIKLGETGDLSGTDAVVWELSKGTPYNSTPLLYGDELYLVRDGGLTRGITVMSVMDAKTGAEHYFMKRFPHSYCIKASPVGAGDKIYLASEEGDIIVLRRGKEFEILATNSMDEMFLASPVVVGGDLFLRGQKTLFCISDD